MYQQWIKYIMNKIFSLEIVTLFYEKPEGPKQSKAVCKW